jgi:hypothetical protein
MELTNSDEIVNVPVPKKHLGVVYKALAQVLDNGPSGTGMRSGDPAAWQAEKVAVLKRELRYPGARAAIELSAAQAPEPVSIRDVEAKSGRSQKEVSADLGALTKLLKKLFQSDLWPMRAVWGAGGENCMYYVMDPEVARLWNEAD